MPPSIITTLVSFSPPPPPMANLHDLLAQDGFHYETSSKPNNPIDPNQSPFPSISICFNRKAVQLPHQCPSRALRPSGSLSFVPHRSHSLNLGSNQHYKGVEPSDLRQDHTFWGGRSSSFASNGSISINLGSNQDPKSVNGWQDHAFRQNGPSIFGSISINSTLVRSTSSVPENHKAVDLGNRQHEHAFRSNGSTSFNTNGVNLDAEQESETDEAAVRAVVAILSGYAGRFLKDTEFRQHIRDKCATCLSAARKGSAHAVLANLELGMESTERLASEQPRGSSTESKIKSLRNSIRLLSIVAALNSPKSRDGYTCGVPNAHLSACAQLYLAIVYKIERNNRVSARHLLQVFCDAPYLARKNLLPDLWDHFFLPHLLHLKVWYNKEVGLVTGWDAEERDQRIKGLNRVYNDQMDVGTAKFALYYKEWIKVGGVPPTVPSVALPSRPSCIEQWGKRSASVSPSSITRNLYQVVFGPKLEQKDVSDGVFIKHSRPAEKEEKDEKESSCKLEDCVHSDMGFKKSSNHVQEKPIPEAAPVPRRSLSFRLFTCGSEPNRAALCRVTEFSNNESTTIAPDNNAPVIDLAQAINLISNSDKLSDCENAIHVVAKVWLDSHGDSKVERALSTSSIIEGFLEISFTSKDEEVLELVISLLAELVARNEVTRQVVLNADPQLEIFLRLLKSNELFLKAAVLLYLLKPMAKQMLSLDWIPLVLRVLEQGDHLQTLFTVQCSPRLAAFYFLDQLLMGFDVDRKVENAKQMVALGGLDLLIRRLEMGDTRERKCSASLLATCLQADGSCRSYLAVNIKKASIIKLLIGNQLKSDGTALSLLAELVSLNRRTQITKFLNGLKNNGCLNIVHILLVYLQQAPLEQRPLAAAMLLLLDLLDDPLQYSVYREEGIDTLVAALEWKSHSKKVQEQCSRSLLLLAGRFSCEGDTTAEAWLLRKAGLHDVTADLFNSKEMLADEYARQEKEEKATEVWLRKLAHVLLTSGNKRFLIALSNCIADGIPILARSCLVTVAWMSNSLHASKSASSLQSLACSILAPRLLECLNYDRALEERVLASFSLLNYVRNSECLSKLFPLDKETIGLLEDLSQVTWTAKELLFACCR